MFHNTRMNIQTLQKYVFPAKRNLVTGWTFSECSREPAKIIEDCFQPEKLIESIEIVQVQTLTEMFGSLYVPVVFILQLSPAHIHWYPNAGTD